VTSAGAVPQRRRGLLVPALLALVGCAVLVALGTWQLERKAWKETLIDRLTQRLAAAPAPVPPPRLWAGLDAQESEFRHVGFRAELLVDREALVFTSGSALRSDTSGPGYWVFAPARLADGSAIVVNRGFVPEGRQNPATRPEGQTAGPVDIVGVMRWPEARGTFTPGDDPGRNLWFVRDHLAIGAAKGWGTVAPFYVDQEAPNPPGGLPRAGKLTVNLPDNHLQYAITWYGLAAVLVGVFAVFAAGQLRESRRSDGRDT
jgi:surfeit locus 1 family protein